MIEEILSKYVKFEKKGKEFVFLCPFHNEETPSCFMNQQTGQFHCFGCKKGGGFKKFLSLIGSTETIDYSKLIGNFYKEVVIREEEVLDESILTHFQYKPESLLSAGFKEELLWNFKIGFHWERKRNIFPIRNIKGELVGVSGGSVIGGSPKYKVYRGAFYAAGKKIQSDYGVWFDEIYPNYGIFDKSSYIWNLHNVIKEDYRFLVVVEGFKAALWLIQNGYPNTIALMGSNLSDSQVKELQKIQADIYLMLDNDFSGWAGKDICIKKLFDFFPLFEVNYDASQPDDLEENQLGIIGKAAKISRKRFLELKEK